MITMSSVSYFKVLGFSLDPNPINPSAVPESRRPTKFAKPFSASRLHISFMVGCWGDDWATVKARGLGLMFLGRQETGLESRVSGWLTSAERPSEVSIRGKSHRCRA